MPLLPILVCFLVFFYYFFAFAFLYLFSLGLALDWLRFHTSELSPDQYSMCMPSATAAVTKMKNNFIPFVFGAEWYTRIFGWFAFSSSPSSLRDFVVDRINCFDMYFTVMYRLLERADARARLLLFSSRHRSRCLLQLDGDGDDDDIIMYPICACRFASMWRRCIQCANFVFVLNTTERMNEKKKREKNFSSRMRIFAIFLASSRLLNAGLVMVICTGLSFPFAIAAFTFPVTIRRHDERTL